MATPAPPDEARRTVEAQPMRVGVGQFMNPSPERLRYISQLGVEDVLVNFYQYDLDYPHLPNEESPLDGEDVWSEASLNHLRETIEAAGLRLNAIENVPIAFYDDIMLGRKGREEQMERLKTTIKNVGAAGIPVFGYHWMPGGVTRTGSREVRGGATATAFDADAVEEGMTHGREYTEAELWENYEWFLDELLPVAEEAGVTLCVHPNDPPVERIGGIPQLFRSFDTYDKAMNLVDSDHHGIEFCLGCWSEMGEDVAEAVRYFGERDEIVYVHFRDVEGTVPSFNETFVDCGNYDPYRIMSILDEVGFRGLVIPDHVPRMEGNTDWDHRGRAYTVGYLRGLQRSISERSADSAS